MKRKVLLASAVILFITAIAIIVTIIVGETSTKLEHNITRDNLVEGVLGDKDISRDYVKNSSNTDNGLHEQRAYNIRDLFTYIALIFTVISVAIGWVLHTMKGRKDPLRKWFK